MGIVINYRGTLNRLEDIDALIADVRQFSETIGWRYNEIHEHISGVALNSTDSFMKPRVVKEEPPEPPPSTTPAQSSESSSGLTIKVDPATAILLEETARGINVHPPDTDSLSLTFDSKGVLCRYMEMPDQCVHGPLKGQSHYFCFPLFCKTTGAVEQHIAICALLKLLRQKYISDLQVTDETGFFESGNLKQLERSQGAMASLIGSMRRNPEFLKALFAATGMDESSLDGAVVLPGEVHKEFPANAPKAKKATVH